MVLEVAGKRIGFCFFLFCFVLKIYFLLEYS